MTRWECAVTVCFWQLTMQRLQPSEFMMETKNVQSLICAPVPCAALQRLNEEGTENAYFKLPA